MFTHISARLPGTDHHFLINSYGMTFDEITASNLVKIDLDGRTVLESPYEINPAGWPALLPKRDTLDPSFRT